MRSSTLAALALLLGVASCSTSDSDEALAPWPEASDVVPSGRPVLLVASAPADRVSALELDTLAPAGRFTVGRTPVEIDGPASMARDADGFVYVLFARPFRKTDVGPHEGHGSYEANGWVSRLAPRDLSWTGHVRVDEQPGMVAISPGGRELVVSHFDTARAADATLADVDRRADLIVFPTGPFVDEQLGKRVRACRAPNGITFAGPARRNAFVACHSDDALAEFDLDDPSVLARRTPLPSEGAGQPIGPFAIDATSTGELLAVGTVVSSEVMALKAASVELSWRRRAAGPVVAVAWSPADDAVAALSGTPPVVELLSRADGTPLARRDLSPDCKEAKALAWGPGGRSLIVACAAEGDAGRVHLLDPATLNVTKTAALDTTASALLVLEQP